MGTAVAVSRRMFDPGVDVVFIARDDLFADALSGGPMAALRQGPVLLVRTEVIPAETATELRRLSPDRIIILGGVLAVSEAVERELTSLTAGTVERIDGADRYETAALVSARQFPDGASIVYVATGEQFADALAGGAAAARAQGPVLLVRSTEVPPATARELQRLAPERVIVLGGPASIPAAILDELSRIAGVTGERLAGPSRYETSASISRASFPDRVSTVFIATGEDFPDALAATPAAGIMGSPLLIVRANELPDQVRTEICRLQPMEIVLIGGATALGSELEAAMEDCLR